MQICLQSEWRQDKIIFDADEHVERRLQSAVRVRFFWVTPEGLLFWRDNRQAVTIYARTLIFIGISWQIRRIERETDAA